MSIQANNQEETREGSRIAKVMARAGLCSRRDAEQWIAEGRVSVNGEVLTSPAFNVGEADDVRVDGEPLRAAERTRLFLFHKPRGLVTTAKDPEGRSTIFDALPEDLPRVVAVGRLDINTEGLLLLTNDGGLSRVLELPATGWLRRYRVRAHGEVTQEQLDGLHDGITIDGIHYLGIEARFERQQGANVWLMMGLREGKNREIKRVLEHMGLGVNRLIRVSFGPFELGDLAEGEVMEVRTRVLRDQLGPKLAKQAGANFEGSAEAEMAPVVAPPAPRGDRPMRRPREAQEPPRREDAPQKRKHVSVLRAEAREGAEGPRRRIARSATSDRKGREIKVERVMLARPPEFKPDRSQSRRREGPAERRPSRGEGEARPAQGAFRSPRNEGRPFRAPRAEGDARPERSAVASRGEGRPSRPRFEGGSGAAPRGDRAFRPSRGEGDARAERSPRAPRADSPYRASRSEGSPPRPPRAEGDARTERSPRTPRPDSPYRSPRSEGRPARPPRAEGDARAERSPRAPRPDSPYRSPRSEGRPARPPRAEGDARAARAPRGDSPYRSSRNEGRPARAEGEARAERAPRAEGSFRGPRSEGRPSRAPRAEGASRAPRGEGRPARAEGGVRPPRSGGAPRGKGFAAGGKGKGGPPRGPRPPRGEGKPSTGPRKPRGR